MINCFSSFRDETSCRKKNRVTIHISVLPCEASPNRRGRVPWIVDGVSKARGGEGGLHDTARLHDAVSHIADRSLTDHR